MARNIEKDFNEVYKVRVIGKDPERSDGVVYYFGPFASPDVARESKDRAVYRMRMQGWFIQSAVILTTGPVDWTER